MDVSIGRGRFPYDNSIIVEGEGRTIAATEIPEADHAPIGVEKSVERAVPCHIRGAGDLAGIIERAGAAERSAQGPQIEEICAVGKRRMKSRIARAELR